MDKYSVISMIGEGSFGRVYKATRKSDKKIVALKVILKRGRCGKEIKNLRGECVIQAELKHENIIEMFESFETKNDLVVITEFSSIDLHRYLRKHGTINEEAAQKLTGHLVSALYYLHSNRILHRDLKPQNVLLDDNLHAKLCDFGLARNMTLGTHVLTSIKGTPLYMAPELLYEKPYNHQADLWSLGCIIYETLVGQPPFCTTSILHLVRLMRLEDVKLPSFVSSNCTSFLQGLLEKDPAMRMTWTQILCHPFTENKLNIPEGFQVKEPDFTKSSNRDKSNESTTNNANDILDQLDLLTLDDNEKQNKDNLDSSYDSTHAILQSDIENIETDAEDVQRVNIPFSDAPSLKYDLSRKKITSLVPKQFLGSKDRIPIEISDTVTRGVSSNKNMIVNCLNDNLNQESSEQNINDLRINLTENIQTDAEDAQRINIPFSDATSLKYDLARKKVPKQFLGPKDRIPIEIPDTVAKTVSGNDNMVINYLNDNFNQDTSLQNDNDFGNMVVNFQNDNLKEEFDQQTSKNSNNAGNEKMKMNNKKSNNQAANSRNKDLEKRKLSQNLDNFSLRLGQSHNLESVASVDMSSNQNKKQDEFTNENKEKKKPNKTTTNSTDEKLSCPENTPPCLLPGWDSCDESQSPPIENDEWLAFLRKSTQEILGGEMDSLQQQNLVSIIVAPLRNVRASSEVIENVAKLLILPLVLGAPINILDCIKNVYVEVKLVPNLMYASRLLIGHKSNEFSQSSSTSLSDRQFKTLSDLTVEEIRTLSYLYELTCHLVHLNEKFLVQFCDAVAILSADQLLIQFLTHDLKNEYAIRISNNIIALLCCVVRELPENAELVEKIIFNDKLNLVALMKNPNDLIRSRLCMLFRLLGRFSLRGLQKIWSIEFKETIEALIYDSNEDVRTEAEFVVEELKQFSFYC